MKAMYLTKNSGIWYLVTITSLFLVIGGLITLINGFLAALALLANPDEATLSAIRASLLSTTWAMLAAFALGLPLGFALGYCRFPGRGALRLVSDTLLAFPTVLVGLLVYAFITSRGPLGQYGLLFTLPGLAIGQAVLAGPIVTSWTAQAVFTA